jgi:MFS family permease
MSSVDLTRPHVASALDTAERPPTLRHARIAVAVVFTVHGGVFGSMATRIPWLQDRLHIGPGLLGVALLAPAVGAMLGMPFSSRFIHRFGGRRVTRALICSWCVAGGLPMLAPNLGVLVALLICYGMAAGMTDVAMNAQAIPIEQAAGKSIMTGLHGMWSLGGMLASGAGAIVAHAGVDARVHLGVVAVLLLPVAALAGSRLPKNMADADGPAPPPFVLPPRGVVLIGVIAFFGMFAESAGADWCAVYLRRVLNTGAGTAATAYTAFAFTMASARFFGDLVVRRVGRPATVRGCAIIGTVGGALVVTAGHAAVAIVGFALLGIGVSTVLPLAFSAAGHDTAQPGRAISGVATIAYGAGIAAPGVVGGIAAGTSLRASFAVVTMLIALIAVGAGLFRPRRGANADGG